jgi:hypothetical protein
MAKLLHPDWALKAMFTKRWDKGENVCLPNELDTGLSLKAQKAGDLDVLDVCLVPDALEEY